MDAQPRNVCGYTVTPATVARSVKRMRLLREVMTLRESDKYDEDEKTALLLYPNIAASISEPMTADEYLALPEQTADALVSACMDINPHWFDAGGGAEAEKKTSA